MWCHLLSKMYIFSFLKIFFSAFVPLLYMTAEEWTGNRGERGGMTGSIGPQVESVYGTLALPTEPPSAPKMYNFFKQLFWLIVLVYYTFLGE